MNNLNNGNTSIKKYNRLKIILCVVGIILILLTLRSIYLGYMSDKSYEERGWQIADAICISEKSYRKRNGESTSIHYERTYLYTVVGEQYMLTVDEVASTSYKLVRYDSANPNVAEVYEKTNISDIVILVIGLLCLFSPLLLKFVNFEKVAKMKEKSSKFIKRNTSKIVDIFFVAYLGLSLLLVLREMPLTSSDWAQIVSQYTKLEIFFECFTFIIARSNCTKSTCYIDIFRSENCY